MTESPLLVIGYGNPLRRDDGVGWFAGRRLVRRLPPDEASVLAVHQLLPELADAVSRAGRIIFIDADASQLPGEFAIRPVRSSSARTALGHHQSPQSLLALTDRLYGRSPAAFLYAIGGEDFSHGYGLSKHARRALRQVVDEILTISRQIAC